MKKHLNEVEKRLKTIKPANKPSIWKAENYIGGGRSRLKYLDLKIPDVRNEFSKGFSFYDPKIKQFDFRHLEIFDYIWRNSNNFEAMLFCLFYVKSQPFEVRKTYQKILIKWLDYVDNWAHSDELSSIYSELLEDNPKLISFFKSWNKSSNSWKRRQSVVGVLFYARLRQRHFLKWDTIKSLIDPLLADEDYYVQKGVGWALREAYQWYPKPVFNYISNNVEIVAPAGWYACTEKMSVTEKNKLKLKRRARKSRR